jgi:hypothetical protein
VNRTALLVAALLMAHPGAVFASSGSGGSGGSGGGGGGWSGGSSDHGGGDGSGSHQREPRCVDTIDIVGYRTCSEFGRWANDSRLPGPFARIGMVMRAAASLAPQAGTLQHGDESFTYRTIGDAPDAALEQQAVTSVRIGAGFGAGVYVAIDIEGGTIVSDAARTDMASRGTHGTPTLTFRSRTTFSFIGVVGIQRPIGNGRLGFEAAGGARIATYFLDSRYHDTSTTSEYRGSTPLLEARASYEHWVSPRISAGVTVGKSVIERDSWMGGLHVGFHGRTFGGNR